MRRRAAAGRAAPPAAAVAPAGRGAAPAVELVGVAHRWPATGRRVFAEVDLRLEAGQLAWLSGPNGAGKTTLLRILGGILAPEAGRVAVAGLDARAGDPRLARQVAFLPAGNAGLYARLTVRQHLELWARIAYVPRLERSRRVARHLAALELDGLAGARVDRISAGQRQRVRLATALVAEAPLTLLDEPRSSLDADGLAALARALAAAADAGRTAIWCAPEGEAPGMRHDRALVLRDARLREAG